MQDSINSVMDTTGELLPRTTGFWFCSSVVIFVLSVILAYIAHKRAPKRGKRTVPTLFVLLLGVIVSITAFVIPLHFSESESFLETVVSSIHHAMRAVVLDGEFGEVLKIVHSIAGSRLVVIYSGILFVGAPILAVGSVLSLFRNVIEKMKYVLAWYRPVYVFSELNEKTLALAENIYEEYRYKDAQKLFKYIDKLEKAILKVLNEDYDEKLIKMILEKAISKVLNEKIYYERLIKKIKKYKDKMKNQADEILLETRNEQLTDLCIGIVSLPDLAVSNGIQDKEKTEHKLRSYKGCFSEPIVQRIKKGSKPNGVTSTGNLYRLGERGRFTDKPLLVFADSGIDEEETENELVLRSRAIEAVRFLQDITRITPKWFNKKGFQYFFIGEDENENLKKAIALHTNLKKLKLYTGLNKYMHRRSKSMQYSIYVYSSSPIVSHVINSFTKDKISKESTNPLFSIIQRDKAGDFLKTVQFSNGNAYNDFRIKNDHPFIYVRRIDTVKATIRKMFWEDDLIKKIIDANKETDAEGKTDETSGKAKEKVISVMLLGTGQFAKEFVKTFLWFFNISGYRLDVTVIDPYSDSDGRNCTIRQQLEYDSPDLFKHPVNGVDMYYKEKAGYNSGAGAYTIRFIEGLDCFSGSFDNVIKSHLEKTQLILVSYGDDTKNYEAAVKMRLLIDSNNKKFNDPLLYCVIYSGKMTKNLKEKKKPSQRFMQISFAGDMRIRYSYDVIRQQEKFEAAYMKENISGMTGKESAELTKFISFEPYRERCAYQAEYLAYLKFMDAKWKEQYNAKGQKQDKRDTESDKERFKSRYALIYPEKTKMINRIEKTGLKNSI